jgi:hypothetical protein
MEVSTMTRKAKSFIYNCKTDGDHYRITKFNEYMDVESSYLCTEEECECPAGDRPSCRHRQMLPKFQARKATKGQWFFDYDREGWIKADVSTLEDLGDPSEDLELTDPMPAEMTLPEPPAGITMLDLADIGAVHNAIADAVGEPEAKIEPKPEPKITTNIAGFSKRDRRI